MLSVLRGCSQNTVGVIIVADICQEGIPFTISERQNLAPWIPRVANEH
jgi:hypothetical protein